MRKQAIYDDIIREVEQHFKETKRPIARMATVVAILRAKFKHFFWTGFYLLAGDELTVGPYQGSVACLVLPKGEGVCWSGIDRGEPVIVGNVHKFPGHIVCDGRANSEIVVPLRDGAGKIAGVLDVDSADFDSFDPMDAEKLGRILALIYESSG